MDKEKDNLLIPYRQCFSTLSGQTVLADLLMNAGYFDCDMKTTEELAVENFAKEILHKMGIYNKADLNQQTRFVTNILNVPVDM